MAKKGGLGRGLDALFSENSTESQNIIRLRISEIEPNRDQPRKHFDPKALNELSENIKAYGILQPLVVRLLDNGSYQLVAGERRWRAARIAELQDVPVVIKNLSDSEVMEIALIENLQREDLNPIEEAKGYHTLMQQFSLTQEQVAEKVGKSRPAVANALRLLNLPEQLQDLVISGQISAGTARALLSISQPELLNQAVIMAKSGATVRQIEAFAKNGASIKRIKTAIKRDVFYDEVQIALTELLGRPVKVVEGRNSGSLQISFYNKEDLSNLAKMLEIKDRCKTSL